MKPKREDKKPFKKEKKFADILDRFRNDVQEYSAKFGGVKPNRTHTHKPISRKEKRKFERKLKNAKNLAFQKREKMPTLEKLIEANKKPKKNKKNTKELIKDDAKSDPDEEFSKKEVKSEAKKGKEVKKTIDKPKNAIELVESNIAKEEGRKKNYENLTKKSMKQKLLEDNEREEKEISRLEKMLNIKKGRKKYKQSFYDDGFDELLDFCDEEKRKEIIKEEANVWFGIDDKEEIPKENKLSEKKKKNKLKIDKDIEEEEDNESQIDYDDENEEMEESEQNSMSNEEDFDSNMDEEEDDESINSEIEDENEENGEGNKENDEENDEENEDNLDKIELNPKGLKEDIYGRLVDKKGNIVKTEKYIPPGQRLKDLLDKSNTNPSMKQTQLSKTLNGLLNRLSGANIVSISNQMVQIFYSNQYTRFDMIDTLKNLLSSSLIKSGSVTPIRLIVEHAALVAILSNSIGIELGATLIQKFASQINECLKSDQFLTIENKTLDNLILFLCNVYNFKLVASNLLICLLNDHLAESLSLEDENKLEKLVDMILLIFRCVGFLLRKESPDTLKEVIVKLQSKINSFKSRLEINVADNESINNRLKFMVESLTAIKNNDIRRLDLFDQAPVENIKRQAKNMFKEETQLNVSFNDLINANEMGRWWIVGSAWNLKENNKDEKNNDTLIDNNQNGSIEKNEAFSEKILKLAKSQHMNTDVRKSVFCLIVSAEDYVDAFMKLIKLSLKKQQEREIVYVIVHCALNEKTYNPFYSYLMQKFCDYDRRFKMTLQFHSWDKFKMLNTMTPQQISNFACFYEHLILSGSMAITVLKNVDFGELDKSMLKFIRELLTILITKQKDDKLQEIFMHVATLKKFKQLRNALSLFISHFMLTDKGKDIEMDERLRIRFQLAKTLLNSEDI